MNFPRLIVALSAVSVFSACGVDDAMVIDGDEATGLTDVESELSNSRGRFETFVGRDGQTYFHLLAGNGEKVLASEGYATLTAAQAGIASVKTAGVDSGRYLQRQTTDGAWYFVLTASNGQIIAVSEMYASQTNMTRAITSSIAVVKATVAQGPAAQVATHFKVFKGLDGKHYFHLKANNGEIMLQSQAYASKASAKNGVASVQTNGTNASRYSVVAAADGKFYFRLKAANGQVIGRGQTYATQNGAQAGVDACVALLTPAAAPIQ